MITLQQYNAGEVIIREGDVGEVAYLIEKGQVHVTTGSGAALIDLGHLGAGDIFGEMSIIDEKPRSATVTAVADTIVKEVPREALLDLLRKDEDAAVRVLKMLFNRLRESNLHILHGSGAGVAAPPVVPPAAAAPAANRIFVIMEGATPEAAATLPENPYRIRYFPFRIGRVTNDPLAYNDLTLPDDAPHTVSRHHLMITRENHRVGIFDRGSTLGASVNGQRIGGGVGYVGPIYLNAQEGETALLILGSDDSVFRYWLQIEREV